MAGTLSSLDVNAKFAKKVSEDLAVVSHARGRSNINDD